MHRINYSFRTMMNDMEFKREGFTFNYIADLLMQMETPK